MGFLNEQKRIYYPHHQKRRYDPHHIISKLGVENGVSAYEHEVDLVTEEVANLESWEQVQKVLQDSEKSISDEEEDRKEKEKPQPKYVIDVDKIEEHPKTTTHLATISTTQKREKGVKRTTPYRQSAMDIVYNISQYTILFMIVS